MDLSKTKIAFYVVDYTPVGGVQRVTGKLISLFQASGIAVDYLISSHKEHAAPQFDFPQVGYDYVLESTKKEVIIEKLSAYLKEHKINVLIFSGDNMSISLAVIQACALANCHAIPQYHGSAYAYLKKYIYLENIRQKPILALRLLHSKLVYPFKKNKLRRYLQSTCSKVVCVSEGSANELIELFDHQAEIKQKVTTIYNPLTFTSSEVVNSDTKEKRIVYLARLENKHKNSIMVVKVWKELAERYPDWHLDILGEGPAGEAMRQYCAEHQINNVHFHGMVSDVSRFLSKSSIALLTSNCEGLGVAMIEAAMHKNALVATSAHGGVIDIIPDEAHGLLSPRNDVYAFVQNLESLINNRELRLKLADNVFKRMHIFNDSRILRDWKQLLADLKPVN